MRIRRKMKKSTKQYIAVAMSMILILGGSFAFLLIHVTRQINATYEMGLQEKENYISSNTRTVFCVTKDITAGECITPDKVIRKEVLDSRNEEVFITEVDFTKAALVDIPEGSPVTKTMVNQESMTNDQRIVEYQSITISSTIEENDVVDIRICYPDGEDYLILSKKTVHDLKDMTSCSLWLNEEELLLMSSALVDLYLFQGGKIYTTKYIEPTIQDGLLSNYIPSKEVADVISKDPNIIETASAYLSEQQREELEGRMEKSDGEESIGYYGGENGGYVYEK